MPELTRRLYLLWMNEITSYPLMGTFRSSDKIIMSMKFLIILSCILFNIFPSNLPPPTRVVESNVYLCSNILFQI